MAFFEFPHTRTYDSDLGWLIKAFKEISEKLDTYLENAVIKFADPITWNITEQYTALTCVIDSDGTAYLSKQPVPAGVDITNTDYWLPIFNYDDNINDLRDQIAYNARNNATTGISLNTGDLVFWDGILYHVLVPMASGTAFIIGTNIEPYTVDDKINAIPDYSADIEALQQAETELSDALQQAETELRDADTVLQANINAEAAARLAADNDLSTRINAIRSESGEGSTLYTEFLGRIIRTDAYASAQGMTTKYVNGVLTIYVAYYNYVDSNPEVVIQAMTPDGSIIRTSPVISCDHGNDMVYNSVSNELYIISGASLIQIDPVTLNVINTISLDYAPSGITYDPDNSCYYTLTDSIIRKLNTSFVTLESYDVFPYADPQGLEYHNNILYVVMNQPNNLIALNTTDFSLVKIYQFEDFCSQYYPLGETQCISFYGTDDDLIVTGKPREYNKDTGSYEVGYGITVFAHANIKSGVRYETPYTQLALLSKYHFLFVNSDITVFKPTGSSSAPYKTLGEIAIILNAPYTKPTGIYLTGDFSTETLAINNHTISIGGNDPAHPVKIYGASIYECDGILRNVRIMNDADGALHLVRSRMAISYVYAVNTATHKIMSVDTGSIALLDPLTVDIYNLGLWETKLTGVIETRTGSGVVSSDWDLLVNNEGAGNSTARTLTLSDAVTKYRELLFVVMRSSNSRVVDSKVIPAPAFVNGGCYIYGGYSTDGHATLAGVFIYVNPTSVQIEFNTSSATENFKYRIYAR